MRSHVRDTKTITSQEVHKWALDWLLGCRLLKDHGPRCTAVVVWSIVLRAAASCLSIYAACRDLANAPCDQAIRDALHDGLPKTLPVLECRVNDALLFGMPRRMLRRAWDVAIDWHLVPYYGRPARSRNELCYNKPRQGTNKFHAYATACIVVAGHRYTVALTWVRRHESTVTVLRRLLLKIGEIGLKIRRVLLDRAFFGVPVIEFLQQEKLPFLMPVVIRGRKPKRGRRATGLRRIRRQAAGWYPHTMKNGARRIDVQICVGYRSYYHAKKRRRRNQKLLFAAWGVFGSPTDIRDWYRRRFAIETSFRQLRQARIYTCTRCPHLRLLFVAIALILRNVWVWIHQTYLAEGLIGHNLTVHLERLRFKRMLGWIASEVVALLHDGSRPYVAIDP